MIGGRGIARLAAPALAAATALLPTALTPPPAPALPDPPASTVTSAQSAGPAPASVRPALGAGALAVLIDTMQPAVPTADGTVTLTGSVTNVANEPVASVAVALRISPTPLPSRGEIPEVLAGGGQRTGNPVAGSRTELAAQLEPGQSLPFTVTAEVASLGLGPAGVYVTGVEAVGSTGAGPVPVRQDIDRTFLPWWPEGTDAAALPLTTLWPLVGPPVQDASGTLLDEEPAVQMSPAGRLDVLLGAAASQPSAVSLVVDPQAVQMAADLADGYQVQTTSGVVVGTRRAEVAGWLAAVQAAVADPRAGPVAMLYAQPDVVAARRGRVLGAALRQRPAIDAMTADVLGRDLPATMALVPGGVADNATMRTLAGAGLGVAVLFDRALPLSDDTYFTPSGLVLLATESGDIPVLLVDSGLADTLAMPLATEAQRTAARQRLLAETLTTVVELPETERLLVAAPDAGWSPPPEGAQMIVDTLAATPWIRPTSVAEALAREPSTLARDPLQYLPEDRAEEIPATRVETVRGQYEALRAYAEVVSDPADLTLTGRTAPTRGLAGWFRADPAQGSALVDAVQAQFQSVLGSVTVVSSGSVTVAGTTGTIPITVENLGPVPVTVGLTMTSSPPQLFDSQPVAPFRIEPERRTSVEVVATVAGAGPVPVAIQLTTAEGTPFGTPGELTVQSSAYANAARILVRLALAALALAVVVHGVRRAHRRRGARRGEAAADRVSTTAVTGG